MKEKKRHDRKVKMMETTPPPARPAERTLTTRRRCRRTAAAANYKNGGTEDASLFVRLHPSTARALRQDALAAAASSSKYNSNNNNNSGDCWTIAQERGVSPHVTSGIEFLPLEIRLLRSGDNNRKEIKEDESSSVIVYASYNGGDIADEHAIELPESLLPLPEEDIASFGTAAAKAAVRVVPRLGIAKEVTVEPITVQDWQRLQRHADWLESEGGILNQVSLVYRQQELYVSLLSNHDYDDDNNNQSGTDDSSTTARIRILQIDAASTTSRTQEDKASCLWPNDKDESIQQLEMTPPPCFRILANTEFVLIPKMENQSDDDSSSTFSLQAAREEYTRPMQELYARLESAATARASLFSKENLVSCPQGTIVIHPESWQQGQQQQGADESGLYFARISVVDPDSGDHDNNAGIEGFFLRSFPAQVILSGSVKKNAIVLHPLDRIAMGLALSDGKVSVEAMLPIEWEHFSSTKHPVADVSRNFALQTVKLVRSSPVKSFCSPGILDSSTVWPPFEGFCFESNSGTPMFCIGSLVSVSRENGSERSIMRLARHSSGESTDESPEHVALSLKDVRVLVDTISFDSDSEIERIESNEMINILPSHSVLSAKLLSLEPCIHRNESFVLAGNSGSGKTHAALILASMFRLISGRHVVYLDCKALKNLRRMVDILDAMQNAIIEAKTRSSVLLLDDLDELVTHDHFEASTGSGAQVQQPNWSEMEQSKLICDHLRHLLHDDGEDLPIIITCEAKEGASSILSSRVHHGLQLPLLDASERVDVFLKRLFVSEFANCDQSTLRHVISSLDFEGASRSFLPVDLCTFAARVEKAITEMNFATIDLTAFLQDEVDRFVPVTRDAASVEDIGSRASWEDVGGLFEAKQELLDTVFRPATYRRIYEKSRVRLPRGILLYGPSGSGKSFLVPALANHCRLPLLVCRGPELLDRYIGGSEAKVRELFGRAFLAAPCILFLDEFDALAPKRGSDSTGVTDRVVNQLLTFLDGVEDMSSSGTVYIVAATSRPDKIDPALLRPGRLEKHVYIGLPETSEEIIDVIERVAKDFTLADGLLQSFCKTFVSSTKLLSPADIRSGFQTAHLLAIRERLQNVPESEECICITAKHLHEGFSKIRPSLSQEDDEYFKNYKSRFRQTKLQTETDVATVLSHVPTPLRTALK